MCLTSSLWESQQRYCVFAVRIVLSHNLCSTPLSYLNLTIYGAVNLLGAKSTFWFDIKVCDPVTHPTPTKPFRSSDSHPTPNTCDGIVSVSRSHQTPHLSTEPVHRAPRIRFGFAAAANGFASHSADVL